MKHCIKILTVLSLFLVGTLTVWAIQPMQLIVPTQKVSFSADGGTKSVSVTSRGGEWELLSDPASWAAATKTATGVKISVGENTSTSSRSTSFTVGKGSVTSKVTISQAAASAAVTGSDNDKVGDKQNGSNVETFTVNGVRFEMVRVEGGTFQMGSNEISACERPVHSETVGTFYIGRTEVTQALWEAVMGSNPSRFIGANNPVDNVSWDDCQEFIDRLNRKTGRNFRLPSEAEWEYAARGGNRSKGYTYSGGNDLYRVGWYEENSNRKTHPVGRKLDNELCLFDMSGNVWEWCQDCWRSNYNASYNCSYRVLRGGAWGYPESYCRVAFRDYNTPSNRGSVGMRLAL